jgi:hypothetical protein
VEAASYETSLTLYPDIHHMPDECHTYAGVITGVLLKRTT